MALSNSMVCGCTLIPKSTASPTFKQAKKKHFTCLGSFAHLERLALTGAYGHKHPGRYDLHAQWVSIKPKLCTITPFTIYSTEHILFRQLPPVHLLLSLTNPHEQPVICHCSLSPCPQLFEYITVSPSHFFSQAQEHSLCA